MVYVIGSYSESFWGLINDAQLAAAKLENGQSAFSCVILAEAEYTVKAGEAVRVGYRCVVKGWPTR